MNKITKPLLLDETGHLLVAGIARQNLLLSQMITAHEATPAAELDEIHTIVRSGEAQKVFTPGEQLMLNYNDGTNSFVLPWDIVDFGTFELQDGETVPGMIVQSHYGMQGVQFDASEAAFIFPSGLSAGTYHFAIGTNWGTNCVAGSTYQFTTTVNIPAGGCVVLGSNTSFYTWGAPDVSPENWRVYTFASLSDIAPLETLTLASGDAGTDLGTLSSSTKYATSGPNNLQRAAYGYNRWRQSANRQFYNSSAAIGSWWNPQNEYDRPPQQLATIPGFMSGFDEAFLNIIKPVKVTTALNTVSDSELGTTEDSFDTFFLPSIEEEYIVPQLAGAEGFAWEYWKQRLGLTSPQVQGGSGANAFHIRYAYNAKTSPQSCRLRSAYRGYASLTWCVFPLGNAPYYHATDAFRGCPACVIC